MLRHRPAQRRLQVLPHRQRIREGKDVVADEDLVAVPVAFAAGAVVADRAVRLLAAELVLGDDAHRAADPARGRCSDAGADAVEAAAVGGRAPHALHELLGVRRADVQLVRKQLRVARAQRLLDGREVAHRAPLLARVIERLHHPNVLGVGDEEGGHLRRVRGQQHQRHEREAEHGDAPARGQRRVADVAAAEKRLQRHEHGLGHAARVTVGVVLDVRPPFHEPHRGRRVHQHGHQRDPDLFLERAERLLDGLREVEPDPLVDVGHHAEPVLVQRAREGRAERAPLERGPEVAHAQVRAAEHDLVHARGVARARRERGALRRDRHHLVVDIVLVKQEVDLCVVVSRSIVGDNENQSDSCCVAAQSFLQGARLVLQTFRRANSTTLPAFLPSGVVRMV